MTPKQARELQAALNVLRDPDGTGGTKVSMSRVGEKTFTEVKRPTAADEAAGLTPAQRDLLKQAVWAREALYIRGSHEHRSAAVLASRGLVRVERAGTFAGSHVYVTDRGKEVAAATPMPSDTSKEKTDG